MRRILLSSLFLSTALLHAQAGTKGQGVVLEARNERASASAIASPPATDVNPTSQARRISTGVKGPKLISQPPLTISTADFPAQNPAAWHPVVSFTVDEHGNPQNVHMTKSVNQSVDERVMTVVRGSRYEPATLNDQYVAVDVNLTVNFEQR
jgi:TonB family protein